MKTPSWLRRDLDGTYAPKDEDASAIRQMFAWCRAGIGIGEIAEWTGKPRSTIHKILQARAVVGERGYPALISEDEFEEAHAALSGRNKFRRPALVKANAVVKIITWDEAAKVILKHEWLGTMPASMTTAVGLFFGEFLAGVEVFSATKPGGWYSLHRRPAICLSRGACVTWAPSWAGSFLVSRSLRFIDADKYHFAVAYSETGIVGEIGTIYQAANWICIGVVRNEHWLAPNGERRDCRTHRDRGTTPAQLETQGWRYIKDGATRWRYAQALGTGKQWRERRRYLEEMAVPYPKRTVDSGSIKPVSQAAVM